MLQRVQEKDNMITARLCQIVRYTLIGQAESTSTFADYNQETP
jgi:hypothetical protein